MDPSFRTPDELANYLGTPVLAALPKHGVKQSCRATMSKSILLGYYGFQEEPFGATRDSRCLYPSSTHREALASLKYGFASNRGFTALIAQPGMGKTTLLFRFLEDIRESARSVFLFNIDPQCESKEIVSYILRDLGIVPGRDSAEMHEQLNNVVVGRGSGRT